MTNKDPVFLEEQAYLTTTQRAVQEHLQFLDDNPDFATGSFFEALYGDVMRRKDRNANRQEHAEYTEVYQVPFVGRMDFETTGEDSQGLTAYIGEKSVYFHEQFYVYDWRTPVGQRYYMKNELEFQYNSYEYRLLLRRALFIQEGQLMDYDTEYQSSRYKGTRSAATGGAMGTDIVTEPFLIRILNEKRKARELTPIIISMQEEQNNINRLPIDKNIIVQGCAGSGKTMVLLHRMSYLKFNHPDLNWERVKIITPNEMFNTHINALSQRLELSKIQRITVEKYYANILAEYEEHVISLMTLPLNQKNKEKRLAREKIQKQVEKIQSESGVDKEFLAYIYSDAFETRLKAAYEHNWAGFEKRVDYDSIDRVNENFGFNKNITFGGNTYKKIDIYLQTIHAILSSENSAREQLVQRKERLEVLAEKLKRDSDFVIWAEGKRSNLIAEIKEQARQMVAQHLAAGEPNTVKNQEKINYLSPNLEWHFHTLGIPHEVLVGTYKQVVSIGDDIAVGKARQRETQEAIDTTNAEVAALLTKVMDGQTYEALVQSRDTLASFRVEYLLETSVADALGEEYGKVLAQIKEKERYRFWLYAKILFFYLLYGQIRVPDSLLAVDEGQDISPCEYRLMNAVNGGVTFNIYGDTNQLIKEGRGVDNWDKLADLCGFERFLLNINYRNTMQIAAFCNSHLHMETTAVGISGGDVAFMALEDLPYADFSHTEVRTAIVCKDLKAPFIKRIMAGLKKTDNVVFGGIEAGKVSVIDIESAKGLEFDKVYVIHREMGRNEEYIAYTRALSELVVVS